MKYSIQVFNGNLLALILLFTLPFYKLGFAHDLKLEAAVRLAHEFLPQSGEPGVSGIKRYKGSSAQGEPCTISISRTFDMDKRELRNLSVWLTSDSNANFTDFVLDSQRILNQVILSARRIGNEYLNISTLTEDYAPVAGALPYLSMIHVKLDSKEISVAIDYHLMKEKVSTSASGVFDPANTLAMDCQAKLNQK